MTVTHLEDGAAEVVETSPKRPLFRTADLAETARAPAGGRLVEMRAEGAQGRREFLILRTPTTVARVALTHLSVLHAVWKASTSKRVAGAEDHGVSIAEIADVAGKEPQAIRPVLMSLRRNGLIRSISTHIGARTARAIYYPSEAAVLALSMGEVLGLGSSVQVGRSPTAFGSRARTEPANLFQFASLLRGGGEAPTIDPEFA